MAENTIDNLSIQVVASAEKAISTFNRLASGATGLKSAANGAAGGMQDMAQGARDAGAATQQAGIQSGRARPNIIGVGKDAKDAGNNAKKGASGLATFWQSLKRIAFYRFIRSVIKEITSAFSEGIKNLYHWSDLVNGHFAASMDRLATSTQYLKNSLGAMVAPLIESFIPVLDAIIDKVVDVLNFFNMLVSAVSGADTYTVAKKAAAVWDDSANKTKKAAKSTADDIKRTILGFDEINKLVKPKSSSGSSGSSSGKKQPNYAAMFEEKPLEGFFKKISEFTSGMPDWLKWLFGGAALVGGFLLIKKFIPWLLKKLGTLFAMKIPEWLKWLFGPKSGGDNNGTNIPDKITMPDTTLPVKIDPSPDSIVDKFTDLWKSKDRSLPFTGYISSGAFIVFNKFLALWESANKALPMTAYITTSALSLYKLFLERWEAANKVLPFTAYITTTAYDLYKIFNDRWEAANRALAFTAVISSKPQELFNYFSRKWEIVKRILVVFVRLEKYGWKTLESFVGTYSPLVYVRLGKTAWSTLSEFVGTYSPIVYVRLGKTAWTSLADYVGTYSPIVYVSLKQGWYGSAYSALGLDKLNATAWVEVMTPWWYYRISVLDWLGLSNLSTTVTINTKTVSTKSVKKNNVSNGYGGGSGGGGGTTGGGVGRSKRANGGIYSNGRWSDVPKYASGISDVTHGTMFWAGENGAEIVGNAGGRTEVLNRSQIASSIFSAVRAAMAPAASNFAAAAQYMNVGNSEYDNDSPMDMIQRAVEAAMSRSNDYDRQKLELLRQINDKDLSVEYSTSAANKAQTRMNRRAGVTVVPVG